MSKRLEKIQTGLGERSTLDAAAQCSRCGYCEQSCPTYAATGSEARSPRGRNQLVRMLLEGRLDDPASAQEILSTCLLCGACATVCYAHVPTAEIVLEGRRLLREKPPWAARLATGLLARRPRLLARLLKAAYGLRRLGVSRLAAPGLKLLGLDGLAQADRHLVRDTPRKFLFEILPGLRAAEKNPAWLYFAPCGPNYLFPEIGLATWSVLEKFDGPGSFLNNSCCGLLSYNYGSLEDARGFAQKNIENWEARGETQAPVVADCSSCAAFLKNYPQLFPDDPSWRSRAQSFAAKIQDAVQALDRPGEFASPSSTPMVYHESCRARHGQGLHPPERALKSACGPFRRALQESDACCGGAGAFSFLHPELSDEILRRKIGCIAQSQAEIVVTSSTSCLLQLAHGLRKYYPQCQVLHLSELLALSLTDSRGTQTGTRKAPDASSPVRPPHRDRNQA